MPSKLHDPKKVTFYPDNSLLCDAFKSNLPGGMGVDGAYRPLKAWLEHVANEANLCLSIYHIGELARWQGEEETADTIVKWYEALPVVWAKSPVTLEHEEFEHWTKIASGVQSSGVNPYAGTLLGAFHSLTPAFSARLLGRDDQLSALLNASRELGHKKEEQFMGDAAQGLRDDLQWATTVGLSDKERRERDALNERVELRKLVVEADERLGKRRDPVYLRKSRSCGEVQDLVVSLYERQHQAFPYFRVQRRFWAGFRAAAHRREAGSNSERSTLSGALEDNMHASVGAAYCDVFTCDGEVAEWLGHLRTDLGLPLQLSPKNYPGGGTAFVRALMALPLERPS